jgi:hypothetical protein
MVTGPTYGDPGADPALAAYTIMYGWMGHLTEVGRIPWMREAFRYRGSQIVEDAVEPRWWRSEVSLEACGFRQGQRAMVNVLSHSSQPGTVTVKVDTGRLGLTEGRPLHAQLRLMNDTANDVRPSPADPQKQVRVYQNTAAVTVSELLPGKPCPKVLELTVLTRPMLLTTVALAHTPEALR